MDASRSLKRGNPNFTNGAAASKRFKEKESFQPGIGSKSKPCMKFFSTSGCQFGEGCHFLHYYPGGYQAAVAQMSGNPALAPAARNPVPPQYHDASAGKSRMCNKYNTAEGCKFGDKCHFAHGEWELGTPGSLSYDGPLAGGRSGRYDLPPPNVAGAAGFGTSAATKISVDASLAGAIIGKGGANTKHISRVTGVKLAIRDHESDPNMRNIELEGTFDQIDEASTMVRELIGSMSSAAPQAGRKPPPSSAQGGPGSHFKTKMCENFTKGTCTFGGKCHFAHGAQELRSHENVHF